jgi:hypothetical protein
MSAPFAQITQGPATATGNNPNKQALIFDRQNNIVESVGDAGVAASLQAALTVIPFQTALTAITTLQKLVNYSLNAGVLNKQARTLEVSGQIIFTVATGTPTMAISLGLGTTTLCTITSGALQAGTNLPCTFTFAITTASTGAAGTMESHGLLTVQLGATPPVAVTQYLDTNVAVSSAVALNTALSLVVGITGSTAIASAQLRQFILQLLN